MSLRKQLDQLTSDMGLIEDLVDAEFQVIGLKNQDTDYLFRGETFRYISNIAERYRRLKEVTKQRQAYMEHRSHFHILRRWSKEISTEVLLPMRELAYSLERKISVERNQRLKEDYLAMDNVVVYLKGVTDPATHTNSVFEVKGDSVVVLNPDLEPVAAYAKDVWTSVFLVKGEELSPYNANK